MSETLIREAEARDCDAGAETFLQTGFWGVFKSEFGWKPHHFRVEPGNIPLLVLEKRFSRTISFAYVPRGPALPPPERGAAEFFKGLAAALKPRLSPACVFLRFDPPWSEPETESGRVDRPALGPPFLRAEMDVQPPDTALLAIAGRSDEDLLAGMKPKWRYNIRLAEKKGVVVTMERGPDALDAFYRLYEATAARDRIALHPKRYYARLMDLSGGYGSQAPDIRIWMARYQGDPLAAIITSFRGKEAVYLYGASSDEHRNLMPAYALQWAALRAARDVGCEFYDFYGIPPKEDPGHPMAGLYRFKTGFGGEVLHFAGSWDYPLRPLLYQGYRSAEALRRFWFKTARKRFAGGGGQ